MSGVRGEARYEDFRSTAHFSSLDGLRCMSILAVLWHHSGDGVWWLPASHRGFLGVDMFFVISGFLIVTLLLRERDRTGEISLPKFYARRTLRIFPAYYFLIFVLALVFAFVRQGGNEGPEFLENLPFYLSYTSNWIIDTTFMAIAWSLAAEEQFYLFWPPVERYLRERWAVCVLGGVIVVNQLVNFRLLDPVLEGWFGIRYEDLSILQATFTPICLGVLLAHALHNPRGFAVLARVGGARWGSAASLALLLTVCNLPVPEGAAGLHRLLIQVSMTLLLCSCVVRRDHALTRILSFAPIRRIGVVSYGMYLYHMVVMHFVVLILLHVLPDWPAARFPLCTLLTFMVAEFSYRVLETPFLRLKPRATPLPAQ
jgi:peptidoglycan/LPS O-acetylase OafA/YrhL